MTPELTSKETATDREFGLSDLEFDRVRALIHALAGIALNASKRNMVYSRLARRVRARGLGSFAAYLDVLEREPGAERQAFVNALTTNLTAFFREAHHFDLLAQLLRAEGRTDPARVWSAACATGEEAYSIAMIGEELFPGRRDALRVLATDIDTAALEAARGGVYRAAALGGVEPVRLARHFERLVPAEEDAYRVRPALRERVEFRRLNLLDPSGVPADRFRAIFCRNVMIYFDRRAQRAILERFLQHLASGGILFVGHAESLYWARDLFLPCGRTAYRPARDRAPAGAVDAVA